MQNSYHPAILTFEELNAKITGKQITLPKFQRNVVWGKPKIMKLIETLQKGYPFGSLLLYKKDEENYKLIDGLQRYNAISKYSKEPMIYLPNFDEEFALLRREFLTLKLEKKNLFDDQKYEEVIERIRLKLKKYKLDDEMTQLLEEIEEIPELEGLGMGMMKILERWIKKISTQINFADLKIPVIYFEGDEESLTEVFQNINEGGKPLTKYEIFASAWSDYEIQAYKNTDITNVLQQRYEELQETLGDLSLDFEADNFETMNIFEYCFALSKLVSNAISKTIHSSESDASKIDTLGFSLIAATLGIKNKELHKIGSVLRTWPNDALTQFQKLIVENTEAVMKELYANFSYHDSFFPKTSDFQIVAFIATRIKLHYDIQQTGVITRVQDTQLVNKKVRLFSRNCEAYFLKNLLDKGWGNAGDSKLDEVLDIEHQGQNLLFLQGVENSVLTNLLVNYMEEQKNAKPKLVSSETKAILAWLQTKIKQYEGGDGQFRNYDIEHIVPKQVLKQNKIELLSPLANLCILPSYDNRSKGNQTIYEWQEKVGTLTIKEDTIAKYLYPKKSELEVVSKQFNHLSEPAYMHFLGDRETHLLEKFREYIEKI